MDYICVLLSLFLILPTIVMCVQEFYKQPTNQSAVEGSTIVLRCIIKNRVGIVQWTRGGFGLGTKRNLPSFQRYTMIGTKSVTESTDEYSLKIEELELEDDDHYSCQVSAMNGEPFIVSDVAYITVLKAKCSYQNGVNRFGDKCGFMCHCKNDKECDETTGECPSGCASGWYGPGCQYRDILKNRYSKFSDNNYSLLVTDGDLKTCVKQVKSSSTKHLSWSVMLGSDETINEIQIVTTAKSLDYFQNFVVLVQYIPSSRSSKIFEQHTCFRQVVGIPTSTTFTVLCDKPVIGNNVKIEFAESRNELELCDVKINGGRNLAFNRAVSQVSKHKKCRYKYCIAEASVNGQTRESNHWHCSFTAKEKNPWWKVDIGYKMKIWAVQIISVIGRENLPYTVNITNDTNDASTYSTKELSNDTQTVALNLIGRFVTISINGESELVICEVSVFGDCPENRCGYNCEKECHCEHATVWKKISGNCSISCNKNGKDGQCNTHTGCSGGYYGQNCSNKCSDHCKLGNKSCDRVNGHCNEGCKKGWIKPLCKQGCYTGSYGQNCTEKCSEHCTGGYGNCDPVSGRCRSGCNPGWTGLLCDKGCYAGSYGQNCTEKCSEHCAGGYGNCDPVSGRCRSGCNPGWTGLLCDRGCCVGKFGVGCQENCPLNCININCHHVIGKCNGGCKPGYQGYKCQEKCMPGKFGQGCGENCPSNCHSDVCGNINGNCVKGCKPGFQGNKCEEKCMIGKFGENCGNNCSGNCEGGDLMCRHTDGLCLHGCQIGWNGTNCFSECDLGFYGENCSSVCGNCYETICDHVTGTCHGGCKTGYSGAACLQAMQTSNIFDAIVVGGASVLAIIIIIIIFAIVWRKRHNVWHKRCNQHKRKDEHTDEVELSSAVRPTGHNNRRQFQGGNVHASTDSSSSVAADVNMYQNCPIDGQKRNAIPLSNLLSYVKQNVANPDNFAREFQEIPYGMKKSSVVAKKSYNRRKNRYKDMYAYDETRVSLKTLPNELGSDYINASFIKGHHKEYDYIATQGPIEATICDFWRIILEEDVYTIVMLTNLVEEDKIKCQQYWPPVETSARYGNTSINTVSEYCYSDFTIRNFKVLFKGQPQRNIRQFHFTSWPDNGVPRSTSCLLHFWREVRKNDGNKDHKWLVHCSAGVGQTGTFIALDVLYDQGQDKGCIDVYQCVKDLRDQRVNMVQTKDQYVFLHNLMVEAFLPLSEPIPLKNMQNVVRDLNTVDQATKKTRLLLQYEALKEDMTLLRSEKEVKVMYSAALLKENSSKNRFITVLPPDKFRPILVSNILGRTNYINAVLMPSYSHKRGYYVTQTPLEDTTIDYCRLLYEQNVTIIVKFPDNEINYVKPDMSIGPFKLTKVSEEDKDFYTKTVFNMAYRSKVIKIIQLEFKNWKNQITPGDPKNMLHFMQEVELFRRIADDSPVLVQCLDGSIKSGLFVTLMNIFERAKLDNEVSIPQVIRELRYIRHQIIPNFEQFSFCYKVVHGYVNSQIYENYWTLQLEDEIERTLL